MTTAPIALRRVAPAEAEACVDSLAEVLLDCVAGGASVGFMASLTADKARAFWRGVAQGVQRGERVLLVAEDASGRLVGTVQLLLNLPDNQPRLGLAARLLALLEDEARRAGRTVLVLDTVTGGDAERLYTRAGWQPVGVVPRYALMPDGAFCGTTFFHKAL